MSRNRVISFNYLITCVICSVICLFCLVIILLERENKSENPMEFFITFLSFIVGLITLIMTCIIAKESTSFQSNLTYTNIYTDLLSEYRSTKFGEALFTIIHFYKDYCNESTNKIASIYLQVCHTQLETETLKPSQLNEYRCNA